MSLFLSPLCELNLFRTPPEVRQSVWQAHAMSRFANLKDIAVHQPWTRMKKWLNNQPHYIEKSPRCFIYRLPIDILEAIFIQCAHDYFREDSGDVISTAPGWVNVSYVSRHWRNVALNCPTLWTHCFVTSPRWTDELLSRSKQASLKLAVSLNRWDTKRLASCHFMEQSINHIERIQVLRIRLPPRDLQFLSKLSPRVPRLQHLEVSTEAYPREWSSLLFDPDTPALRTLKLTGCPVPWYSLKLSSLTTLHLCHLPNWFQQNTTEFLATLGCMQDLRDLYLNNALANTTGFLSSAAFHNFQKINLPHLSQLVLYAPLSTQIALLSCVNIPLETKIRLGPDYRLEENVSPLDYAPLCSLLAQRYDTSRDQVPSSLTIRSLVIVYSTSEYECTRLAFCTSERHCDSGPSAPYFQSDCTALLEILLPFRQSTSDRMRLLCRICCSMPLSNVQRVHVFHPPCSSSFWTDVLGHLQGLQHLQLSHGRMPDLASVLRVSPPPEDAAETHDAQASRNAHEMLVPALQALELHDIGFSSALESLYETADVKSLLGCALNPPTTSGRSAHNESMS